MMLKTIFIELAKTIYRRLSRVESLDVEMIGKSTFRQRLHMLHYCALLFLCYGSMDGFALTTMSVEPQQIQADDTFHLILTSDNIQSGGLPNLTPLQNDFAILGTERSISYSMINGQTTSRSQWIILLRPKKIGKITIPAIKIGQEQTPPGFIDVENNAKPAASIDNTPTSNENVMLKTSVSESAPYVNQQALYTVKLYSNTQLLNAEYHPPSIDNALMIPLGDGRHYQAQVNGQLYAVEEQQYAIFPQKSGTLTFKSPSFHAAVYDNFPRQVTVKASPTTLKVRPAPVDYQGKNWLPAKNISLAETYEPSELTLTEGDTLTRTVTLQAVAMPAQLLPALSFDTQGAFNVYPEMPEVKNIVKHNELVGTSTVKVTYLMNKAGEITIPALVVPWFNTTTGKIETTCLPARVFKIMSHGQSAQQTNATVAQPAVEAVTPATATPTKLSANITSRSMMSAFIAGFGAALLLIVVFWSYRRVSQRKKISSARASIKRLREACNKNRPKLARDALLVWARDRWPEATILNLQDVGNLMRDVAMKKQLSILSQAIYNPSQQPAWQGEALWKSFLTYRQTKQRTEHKRSDLPPINP
jgi:hypothetical protein